MSTLVEKLSGRIFEKKAAFPPEDVSRRLCWRNLIFPYLKNNASWTFGFVTALLYLLTTLSVVARIDDPHEHFSSLAYKPGAISATALYSILTSTPTLFLVALIVIGFVFFTDTHSRIYRFVMGGLHGISHVMAAFAIALICVSFVVKISNDSWIWYFRRGGYLFHIDWREALASLLILLGGFVFGALIMGIYLLVSFNFFGRHGNEAFSSLAVEDWKNTVRLHIDETGDLTIYPIGIKHVPRKWKPRPGGETGPELVSDDRRATEPELIEPPVVMEIHPTVSGVKAAA